MLERIIEKEDKYATLDITSLVKLVAQNNSNAQFEFGYRSEWGIGMPISYGFALIWYQRAASQKNLNAQYRVARFHEEGKGVERDETKSVQLISALIPKLKKAAARDDQYAQCTLGMCYRDGWGVKQDYVQAFFWYKKAAVNGDANAQSNLGWCLQGGYGVKQSDHNAIKWFKLAAIQGDDFAQSCLSEYYQNKHDGEQKQSILTRNEEYKESKTTHTPSSVPIKTLKAITRVAPETFLTLANVRPIILQAIVNMGEQQEKIEQEYNEIQESFALQQYYDFFQRSANSIIIGSLAIKSKMVSDARQSSAEKVATWASQNIQIPIMHGTITAVLKTIIGFHSERNRTIEINRLTTCFPNLQNAGVIIEVLARFLTFHQKNKILQMATEVTQQSRLKELIEKTKKLVKWIIAEDINTKIRCLAAEQVETLIKYCMENDFSRPITLKDIAKLSTIITKEEMFSIQPSSPHTPLLTSVSCTLFTTKDAKKSDVEEKEPLLPHEEIAQLKEELAKAKKCIKNIKVERKTKLSKLEKRIKQLEDSQSKTDDALSFNRRKMDAFNVLENLLFEINSSGDKKQVNKNAVEKIETGFARLQARDEEERRTLRSEISITKEKVWQLQEIVEASVSPTFFGPRKTNIISPSKKTLSHKKNVM